MRFRTHAQHRERSLLVELTPMIDVVFLLIIFFLTTAQFARLTRADVDLPVQPGQGAAEDEPGIIINLLRDGSIVVDDETIDMEGLRGILRDEISQQPGRRADRVKLLIRADRNLPAARLNQVVRLLQELGIGLGRFGTELPP